MKHLGRCDHCSKGGKLETVEVTELANPGPVIELRLCDRCAVVPSAVWRRRYQPVSPRVAALPSAKTHAFGRETL